MNASERRVEGGLEICETTIEGNTMTVVIQAKDRPGLLAGVLRQVTDEDPEMNVDEARAFVIGNRAIMAVSIRSRSNKDVHRRLDVVGRRLKSYKDHAPGNVVQSTKNKLKICIHSPDKPKSLTTICQRLTDMNVNIRDLLIESSAQPTQEERIPPNLWLELYQTDEDMTFEFVKEALADLQLKIVEA